MIPTVSLSLSLFRSFLLTHSLSQYRYLGSTKSPKSLNSRPVIGLRDEPIGADISRKAIVYSKKRPVEVQIGNANRVMDRPFNGAKSVAYVRDLCWL